MRDRTASAKSSGDVGHLGQLRTDTLATYCEQEAAGGIDARAEPPSLRSADED
jgi:hypothetical protein